MAVGLLQSEQNYSGDRGSWTLDPRRRACSSMTHLGLKGDGSTQLVGVGGSLRVAELGSVESQTKGSLDTGSECLCVAEAEDTSVVDLGLDKGSVVEVGLGANFEVDVRVGALGVVRGSCTSLGVSVDAVVVAGRVGAQVAKAVEGDGVVGSVEAGTEVVAAELALLDIVAGFGTGKEAVSSQNSVSGESGALEKVKVLAGVKTGLLVGRGKESVLGLLLGNEGRDQFKLESLCNVVLEFNVVAQYVGSGPGLGKGHTVLAVLPLGLEVAVDGLRLGVSDAENAEGDTVGRAGLYLERVAVDGVVLGKQVVGSLACERRERCVCQYEKRRLAWIYRLHTKILPRRGDGLRDDGSFTARGGRKTSVIAQEKSTALRRYIRHDEDR